MLILEIGDYLNQLGSTEVPANFMQLVQAKLLQAPDHVDNPAVKFRASKIGRPWCLQMVERWYGGSRTTTFNSAMSMINGNIIQEVLALVLSSAHQDLHQEVELEHLGVAGHADIVIRWGSSLAVLECKSMAPHMVKSFVQAPNDDFGYLSQLSFYAGCLRRQYPECNVEAGFVLFDRSSSKFTLVPITWSAMDQRIERYTLMVPKLDEVQPYDVEHLLQVTKVPPAILGKLPASMKFSRWANYFYNCDSSGNYEVKTTEQILSKFEQLVKMRADSKEIF